MTIVLVHGNPETAAVWGPMIDELSRAGRRDVVCLSPPGFGAPVPDGFDASVESYRRWLADALATVDGPIDLVGHDWGGGHVVNVAMTRPDLIRSWASDILGVFEPDYVWHEFAQAWQTPGEGERQIAEMLGGTVAARTEMMIGLGSSRAVAEAIATHQDETMRRCILALYRSAAQPAMAELGRELPAAAARPGLALVPTEDPFTGGAAMAGRAAARAGAQVATLAGLGHWWMTVDPAAGARALVDFWDGLPTP